MVLYMGLRGVGDWLGESRYRNPSHIAPRPATTVVAATRNALR